MSPLVKYASNADKNEATEVITGLESSDDIKIGGYGSLTDEEYATLSTRLVLEVVDKIPTEAEQATAAAVETSDASGPAVGGGGGAAGPGGSPPPGSAGAGGGRP